MKFVIFLKGGLKKDCDNYGDIDFLPGDEMREALFVQAKTLEGAYKWNEQFGFWCIMEGEKITWFYSAFFRCWRQPPLTATKPMISIVKGSQAGENPAMYAAKVFSTNS